MVLIPFVKQIGLKCTYYVTPNFFYLQSPPIFENKLNFPCQKIDVVTTRHHVGTIFSKSGKKSLIFLECPFLGSFKNISTHNLSPSPNKVGKGGKIETAHSLVKMKHIFTIGLVT